MSLTASTIDDDADAARAGFAKRLRYVRRMRSLLISELSDRSGVSVSLIGAAEAGRRTPSLDTIALLAGALRCSPEWLSYGRGEAPLWEPLDEEELHT